MLYKPKKEQIVSAIEFNGEFNEELKELGISRVPNYMKITCNCGEPDYKHGLYKNNVICPNQYIIHNNDEVVNVMSKKSFEEIYEPLCRE